MTRYTTRPHPVSYEKKLMGLVHRDRGESLRHYPLMVSLLLFNQLARRAYQDFDTLAGAALVHETCLDAFNQRAPQALSGLLMDRTAGEIEERLTAWEARPTLVPHVPEAVHQTFGTYLAADWEGCNTKGYHALELLQGIGTKRQKILVAIPKESLRTAARKLTDQVRFLHGAEDVLRQRAGHVHQGAGVVPL